MFLQQEKHDNQNLSFHSGFYYYYSSFLPSSSTTSRSFSTPSPSSNPPPILPFFLYHLPSFPSSYTTSPPCLSLLPPPLLPFLYYPHLALITPPHHSFPLLPPPLIPQLKLQTKWFKGGKVCFVLSHGVQMMRNERRSKT